jgi:hypothetical protein
MTRKEFEYNDNRVVHFYANVCERDIKQTVNHFKEGMRPSSIHRIINRYKERGNIKF